MKFITILTLIATLFSTTNTYARNPFIKPTLQEQKKDYPPTPLEKLVPPPTEQQTVETKEIGQIDNFIIKQNIKTGEIIWEKQHQ